MRVCYCSLYSSCVLFGSFVLFFFNILLFTDKKKMAPFETLENRLILVAGVDDSLLGVSQVSFPSITFLLLSSLWTPKNTSQGGCNTLHPRILP